MKHRISHPHPCDTTFLTKAARRTMRFLSNEDGVTAIEYALIASLIVIVALAGIAALGVQLGMTWAHVANEVGNVT
ncbi:Flp family type IVb pilin [Uliginosibacterium flavum]|uniref:Flp family type IVb pilin n=1 Tax=Uliginosibacterium flavum TaxID=1396831 RepID=A0ABV2TIT0_9RHOO